jgi:ABC-2 type transport system ATP-binding protein
MEDVIVVDNVVKRFKTYKSKGGAAKSLFNREKTVVTALDKVSFSVKQGEVVAMLGRNGSGKSTLLKMLIGILHPEEGKIRVLGLDPTKDRIKLVQQVGIVFGSTHPQLWWDLPPIDTFNYIKGMYNIPDKQFEKRLKYFIDLLDLKKIHTRQTRQLSLGERMKCEFVAANIHSPKIVFMDEPTIGVDLPSRVAISNAILSARKELCTTYIITTHVVEDIANVDRIILLDKGKKMFDGTQQSMSGLFKKTVTVELYFAGKVEPKYLRFGKVLRKEDTYVKVKVNPSVIKQGWFISMLHDKKIVNYKIAEPDLTFLLSQMYRSLDSSNRGKV